jgi:hypothetical protein
MPYLCADISAYIAVAVVYTITATAALKLVTVSIPSDETW